MIREAVFHKIDSDYAYAIEKNKVILKIRVKKNDVDEINLLYLDKYKYYTNKKVFKKQMKKVSYDNMFDYYECIVETNMISINYYFELKSKNEVMYYGNYKFLNKEPEEPIYFFTMPTLAKEDSFIVPEWAKESIVYQIFPERFCNGNKENDPEEVQQWYSEIESSTMLGGDLQGIIEKLPYLNELGINTIYLTPVFKSDSNHKYNIFDYMEMDPHFGTKETLKELVKKAHLMGMRVILDAVFNHCGTDFYAFKDVLEKGEESKYKDWFDIESFPVEFKTQDPNYKTFAYCGYMPKMMTGNKEVEDYLIKVGTYWIKEADIDGWRLDVADEITHQFWRKFRNEIKKVKKDAFIVGEIWYDSSAWLKGDQFDSVMNYIFADALKDFIAHDKISVEEFDERLNSIRSIYKLPTYEVMWNLIGSHDTPRFLYECEEDIRKLKLAALIQMTFTGIPFIYYGDEVGMTGGKDPDCRRGMLWDKEKQNDEVLKFYKKIIKIRHDYKALCHGSFSKEFIDNNNKIYGFSRKDDNEHIYVYINNDEKSHTIELKGKFMDILNNSDCNNSIELKPKSGTILLKKF